MEAPKKAYEYLVSGDTDLEGMIAYHLYKKKKLEFVDHTVREENQGKPIRKTQLLRFHGAYCTPHSLAQFRHQASGILKEVGNHFVSNRKREIIQVFLDQQSEINIAILNSLSNQGKLLESTSLQVSENHSKLHQEQGFFSRPFWRNVAQSMVASFVFGVLLALLILILATQGAPFPFLPSK